MHYRELISYCAFCNSLSELIKKTIKAIVKMIMGKSFTVLKCLLFSTTILQFSLRKSIQGFIKYETRSYWKSSPTSIRY